MKNKHLLFFIIGMIIWELLIYCLESYINEYLIIFLLSAISISFVVLLYLFLTKKYKKEYFIYLIFIFGILLRTLYILKTSIYERQHDVLTIDSKTNGHLKYIYLLFNTHKLPTNNEWQFYHPPFYHFIGALWLKLNTLIGVDLYKALEGLQVLSITFSNLIMVISAKIISKLKIKKLPEMLLNTFIAANPFFILLAGCINNDCLLILMQLIVIYLLIKWYKKNNLSSTILLAISTGLCIMTKLNGIILIIPIMYMFIKKYFEKKKNLFLLIKQFILFIIISMPLGLWYQIRNIILFGNNKVPRPAKWLFIGNHSLLERFLIPYKDFFKNIYCQVPEDYNIFTYLIKSSVFDEYKYKGAEIIPILLLIVNTILIILSIYFIFKYIINKKRHNAIKNMLIITWIINIISFLYFNYKYPYNCSMNFRYIANTFIIGSIFLFSESEKSKVREIIYFITTIFILSSILFYIVII